MKAKGVARVVPEVDAPIAPTVAGMTDFGSDLIRALGQDPQYSNKNLVVSPLSVAYAFGMVQAGARGETAKQIDTTFGFPSGGPHAAFNALTRDLVTTKVAPPAPKKRDRGDEPADPVLAIANALFAHSNDFTIEPAFLRTLAEHYGAGVQTLDLSASSAAGEINAWVKKQTAGRIKKLFDRIEQDTKLVIANAVYLKADWLSRFEESTTKQEGFTLAGGKGVQVPMMSQEASVSYAKGDDWQAVELPYAKGELAMWVIVPAGDASAKAPMQLLSRPTLTSVGSGLAPKRVRISMPRWDFGTDVDLEPVLKKLGMTIPFDEVRADFDGISKSEKDLHIKQAVHRANITVDEHGTEAAAVTGVGFGTVSAPPPAEVEVRADRPFAFAVVHKDNHVPLFVGTVMDPKAG